jgi:hypothetical protein
LTIIFTVAFAVVIQIRFLLILITIGGIALLILVVEAISVIVGNEYSHHD